MITLVINTSEPTARLALLKDKEVLSEKAWESTRTLGRELLQELDRLLDKTNLTRHDLTRIAVHIGPGHYSALRSGVVTATTLSYALGIEAIGIPAVDHATLLAQAPTAPSSSFISPHYQ